MKVTIVNDPNHAKVHWKDLTSGVWAPCTDRSYETIIVLDDNARIYINTREGMVRAADEDAWSNTKFTKADGTSISLSN